MTQLNVVFANIFQGCIFAGQNDKKEHLFTGWHPSRHAHELKHFTPDICCIAEMVINEASEHCSFIEKFKQILELPHARYVATSKSWVIEEKDYGLAVFSRFPIIDYNVVLLPNPKLTVTRPNGDIWHTHDKVCQKLVVDVDGQHVQIVNLQSFPFHHFNRRIDEDEFKEFRKIFKNLILDRNIPCIVTGDFNNLHVELDQAFPEFFIEGNLASVVTVSETILNQMGDPNQIDHILLSKHFEIIETKQEFKLSDHPVLAATVNLVKN